MTVRFNALSDLTCPWTPSSTFLLHHVYLVYLLSLPLPHFSSLICPLNKALFIFCLFSRHFCPQQTILLWAKYSLSCSPYSYWSTEGLVPVPSAPISISLFSTPGLLFYTEDGGSSFSQHWHLFTRLQSIRFQKTTIFIVTAVRTSYLMYYFQSWHEC